MKLYWSFFRLCLLYMSSTVTIWAQHEDSSSTDYSELIPTLFQEIDENMAKEKERSSYGAARNPYSFPKADPAARHRTFQGSSKKSISMQQEQRQYEYATTLLANELGLTREQVKHEMPKVDLRQLLPDGRVEKCEAQFEVNCDENCRYRTIDGSCNNLENPSWGMASSCVRRLVDPDYADGISKKRLAVSGNPLPLPRDISRKIHANLNIPNRNWTPFLMGWGQFVDHDITLTPQSTGPNSEPLECCNVPGKPPKECDPIRLDKDDPFYGPLGITCLSNARSAMCSTCKLGHREQIDQLTSYQDASQVYGISEEQSRDLRNFDESDPGTLKYVRLREVGELLPPSSDPDNDQCSFQDSKYDCFRAGDPRVNQQPILTSLHTIFLREHNRLARELKRHNPHWCEERIFQETRRIIAAAMQMITYNEFLPIVLGKKKVEDYGLSVDPSKLYTEYDVSIDATILNEFSTAAYRFGHSLIHSFILNLCNGGDFLKNLFSRPFDLYQRGCLAGLLKGQMKSNTQSFDRYMVSDVTNHVYQVYGNKSGLDLASLNINRGRDHGIPGYTTLLKFCEGQNIGRWEDLDRWVGSNNRRRLQSVYEHWDDIDLFTGGLMEKPKDDAAVGPTFVCIIAEQFYRLKYGDRFFFEHGHQAGSFTPWQLRELKKVTLGKIICDNTEIKKTPQNVLLTESDGNPVQACRSKPGLNLKAWKEKCHRVCERKGRWSRDWGA